MKVTSIFPCQKQGFHPRNTSLAAPALQNLDQGLTGFPLKHFGELQVLGIDILGRQKTNLQFQSSEGTEAEGKNNFFTKPFFC